ncbi:hypothetical protein BGX38DRAFT_800771 [Terfezia claveryi]|nr:hypothetical protein BGX38DRAFT_800771 [Terfezia claveryi]
MGGYSRGNAAPDRSNTVNGTDLKPRRSMSFLRGGTDFMPSNYRRGNQPPMKERKPLYSFGASSFRGDKQVSAEAGLLQKPRSLRMKVRRMSSSIMNSVRRAFFAGTVRDVEEMEVPPQHIVSNRAYFGSYDNASNVDKDIENIPGDLFMSRINSGAPTLQRVPSSIGHTSLSGSIRIVTPPKLAGTPLSSSGNTWASSTTASTLRSATGSKRLSIIREATPKNEGEEEIGLPRPRNKALDAQRVYSAFLRVTRAKNVIHTAHEAERPALDRVDHASLFENPAAQSCSSFASTIKMKTSSPEKSIEESSVETPCPSPRHAMARENKENIPPTQFASESKHLTRTHVKIGPRITLYPPPENVVTPNKEKEREQTELTLKTVRHAQSAFFPYTGGHAMVGMSPSPYKRAIAMSPDAPSIYSRTTSGETPRPNSTLDTESSLTQATRAGDSAVLQGQFVQLGRKMSLVQMNESHDGIVHNRVTPSSPKNSPATYHIAKSRRDENVPFSTYLPGLTRPGEDTITTVGASTPVSIVAGSFGMSLFNRERGRRDVGLGLVTKTGDGVMQKEAEQKHRVLTSKNLQEGVVVAQPETQPLSGIDSNVGQTANIGDKRSSGGMGTGMRLPNRSQVPTGVISFGKKGVNRPKSGSGNTGASANKDMSIVPFPNSVYGGNSTGNLENERKVQDDFGKGTTAEAGSEILGQMSKLSFEMNDGRGYSLSEKLPRTSVDSYIRGPRRLLRNEGINGSVESGIGAFL